MLYAVITEFLESTDNFSELRAKKVEKQGGTEYPSSIGGDIICGNYNIDVKFFSDNFGQSPVGRCEQGLSLEGPAWAA